MIKDITTQNDNTSISDVEIAMLKQYFPSCFSINGTFDLLRFKEAINSKLDITKEGYEYKFSEGGMCYPDDLDKPSRTIITSEGGATPSRFKHVIECKMNKKKRRLTPIELERLNMFPDDFTKLNDITNTKRAFFMGNALVIGIVEKLGKALSSEIWKAQKNQ